MQDYAHAHTILNLLWYLLSRTTNETDAARCQLLAHLSAQQALALRIKMICMLHARYVWGNPEIWAGLLNSYDVCRLYISANVTLLHHERVWTLCRCTFLVMVLTARPHPEANEVQL